MRKAALIVCLGFIIWGIIESIIGNSPFDQLILSIVFGLIAVYVKD